MVPEESVGDGSILSDALKDDGREAVADHGTGGGGMAGQSKRTTRASTDSYVKAARTGRITAASSGGSGSGGGEPMSCDTYFVHSPRWASEHAASRPGTLSSGGGSHGSDAGSTARMAGLVSNLNPLFFADAEGEEEPSLERLGESPPPAPHSAGGDGSSAGRGGRGWGSSRGTGRSAKLEADLVAALPDSPAVAAVAAMAAALVLRHIGGGEAGAADDAPEMSRARRMLFDIMQG